MKKVAFTRSLAAFIVLFIISLPAGAQLSTGSRLISESHFTINTADFPYADSQRYIYSGGRGGDLNHPIKYDSNISYKYGGVQGGTASASIIPSGMYRQYFDAKNNLVSQESFFLNAVQHLFQPLILSTYTYDTARNLISLTSQNWNATSAVWQNTSKQVSTYDALNNLLVQLNQNWDGTLNQWVNNYTDSFTYTTSGKVGSHITHYWASTGNANSALLFSYDVNGNNTILLQQIFQSGAWVNSTEDIYTYGGTNDKLSDIHLNWNDSALHWDTITSDSYTYNAAHDLLTDLNQYKQAGNWTNESLHRYSYDANHNQLVDTFQQWNSITSAFVNAGRTRSIYNSFNQPLTVISENWNGAVWGAGKTGGHEDVYNYETYSTSVAPLMANPIEALSIYPVPAQNILHIDILLRQPQSFTVSVLDVQGRLLQQAGRSATSSTQQITLSVTTLSPGNYFIRVATENGSVAKQFTVTH